MKTIFCDIDGTLLQHHGNVFKQLKNNPVVLDGTIDKLIEWDRKGYTVVLTTGRRESTRSATEKQLSNIGVFYDQLIMGIGSGPRYLINDCKSNGDETAYAIKVKRNEGIKNVEI
jgi:hypothetical protein|tara:strand:- start:5392 stop:5736 length:345 start_codon:yes stop_codon:yes gene_type:complete